MSATARFIDQWMRQRGAPEIAAVGTTTVVVGFFIAMGYTTEKDLVNLRLFPLVLIVCSLAGCAAAGVLTWRRLWRQGQDARERFIYDIGVRRYGVALWVLCTITLPVFFQSLLPEAPFKWVFLAFVAFTAFVVAWPLMLWGGFTWGYIFSRLMNRNSTSDLL